MTSLKNQNRIFLIDNFVRLQNQAEMDQNSKVLRRLRHKKNKSLRPPPARVARSVAFHSNQIAGLFENNLEGDLCADVDFHSVLDGTSLLDFNTQLHQQYPLENAFMMVNLSHLVKKALSFRHYLPRVQPYYAVKCHPDPVVVRTLHDLGVNFDCASAEEMKLCFAAGAKPEDIIYAHPAKPFDHLLYAKNHNVRLMTFDNVDELKKIKALAPDSEVVLRIASFDQDSLMPFSFKFGSPLPYASQLIDTCKELELNLVGVSFHVGSGCMNPSAYEITLERVAGLFEEAESKGFHLTLVDIGGGFPGEDSQISFASIAPVISKALDRLFPADVQVIAEPGRYFVTQMCLETLQIYARRPYFRPQGDGYVEDGVQYYLGDGVYGNFNSIVFDHFTPQGYPLINKPDAPKVSSSFFGPTCDSQDVVMKDVQMQELAVGDWLAFPSMGAYTTASRSNFNGFDAPRKIYYVERVEDSEKESDSEKSE